MRKLFFFRSSSQDSSTPTDGKARKDGGGKGGNLDGVDERQSVEKSVLKQEKKQQPGGVDSSGSIRRRSRSSSTVVPNDEEIGLPVGRGYPSQQQDGELVREITPESQLRVIRGNRLSKKSCESERVDSVSASSGSYLESDGSSPYSSPVPIRCRSARFTHDTSKILDLQLDGEQNDRTLRKSVPSLQIPALGRDSSGSYKKVSRSQSFQEVLDADSLLSSRHGLENIPSYWPNHRLRKNMSEKLLKLSPKKSKLKLREFDAEITSTMEVSASNCLEKRPTFGIDLCTFNAQDQSHAVTCDYFGTVSRLASERISHFPADHLVGSARLNGVYQEQKEETQEGELKKPFDNDAQLLEECKTAEERLLHVSNELEQLINNGCLESGELIRTIQFLRGERTKLAAEVVEQLQRLIAEREYMKNTMDMTKIEHDSLIRKIEKEKNEIQTCLERELDRRSSDWSTKHEKFKLEEKRLRERVRDLAEQNVSLQREVVSLSNKEAENRKNLENSELHLNELFKRLEEEKLEVSRLHQSINEMQSRCESAEAERDCIRRSHREKEIENKDLQRVVVRLQTTCNDQEKTINGLRLNFNVEIGGKSIDKNENVCELQMEQMRLTGLEQTLRRELESSIFEVETLRQENIRLLERFQSAGSGSGSSILKLDQELQARIESLQNQGLFLVDQTSVVCNELLEFIKCKLSRNSCSEQGEHLGEDVYQLGSCSFLEVDMKAQGLRREVDHFKKSLQITSGLLQERSRLGSCDCQCQSSNFDGNDSKQGQNIQKLQLTERLELEGEILLARVLKERLWSKEIELENMQAELASSARLHDILKSEIESMLDSFSYLTHKVKDLELEVGEKNERINRLGADLQQCQKELALVKGMLTQVSKEKDFMREQVKQCNEKNMLQNYELDFLRKKVEALDEDILIKEGQITILRDSLSGRSYEVLCSPKSSQEFLCE